MKITVRTLTKETYICDLEPTDSILNLKSELSKVSSMVDVDYIRLIYAGKILSDTDIINSIKYGSTDFIVMMKKRYKETVSDPSITPVHSVTETPAKEEPSINETEVLKEEVETNTINVIDNISNSQDDGDGDDSQEDDSLLSPMQIMQLMNILMTDPTISEILDLHPQLRTELKTPKILLELLKRMNHPIIKQFNKNTFQAPGQVNRSAIGGKDLMEVVQRVEDPAVEDEDEDGDGEEEEDEEDEDLGSVETLPEVVQITQSEFNELNDIKRQIKEFVGELSITDAQLNGIIYQVYNMLNKDTDATLAYVINRLIDDGL